MPEVMGRAARRAARAAVAAEAFLRLTGIELGLRTVRLTVLARLCGLEFDPTSPAPVESGGRLATGRLARARLAAAMAVLASGPYDDTCLRRALAIGSILRRRRPRLLVGVTRREGQILAHAWVVVDGVNLDPMVSRAFVPFGAASSEVAA